MPQFIVEGASFAQEFRGTVSHLLMCLRKTHVILQNAVVEHVLYCEIRLQSTCYLPMCFSKRVSLALPYRVNASPLPICFPELPVICPCVSAERVSYQGML